MGQHEDTREGNLGEVIDMRVQVYGNPVEMFPRIAEVWSGIVGHTINATDVPLMLIGMKLVRTNQAPDYSDNSDDIEGYLDIFRKIVGDDMIAARSVTEYIERKWPTVKEAGLLEHEHVRELYTTTCACGAQLFGNEWTEAPS